MTATRLLHRTLGFLRHALADAQDGASAALRLAVDDPGGVDGIDDTPDAVRHSFLALILYPIGFACVRLAAMLGMGLPRPGLASAATALAATTVAWLGFAVLSHELAARMQRAGQWKRFIALWNWCAILQDLVLMLLMGLPSALGFQNLATNVLALMTVFWVLWLKWACARQGLRLDRLPAAGFVGLDLLISLALEGLLLSA